MVEVGVRDEHDVHRRKLAQVQPRLAEALQDEKPACEVGIDDDVHPPHLEEEAGMANEGDAELAGLDELWFMGASGTGRNGGMADEAGKTAGSLAKCSIF